MTHSSEAEERISRIKAALGDDLSILAHHYQSDDVLRHADLAGDSLELARRVPDLSARYIVFCGVFFMAESAALLAGERQTVLIPDRTASCVMSDMAPDMVLENILADLTQDGRKVIPLAYVNTSASVKAVCGRYGGAVCTSANAPKMLEWCRRQGDAVLFLPDRNLAANTADILSIPEERRHVLDIRGRGRNADLDAAAAAELVVWPGMCVIHHRFKEDHVREVRRRDPDALVVVHPECSPEVVRRADAAGSTSFIIDYVARAPRGTTIYIGTEINLVKRLALRHQGEKRVLALTESACSNMAKITEERLASQLENIEAEEPVVVEDAIREPALVSLTRMLEASR